MQPAAPTPVQAPSSPVPAQPVQPQPTPQPVENQPPPNSSSSLLKRLIVVLSIIVILGTAGIGLYLIWNRINLNNTTSVPGQTQSANCSNEKIYNNVTEALLEEGKDVCYIDAKAPNEEYVFPTDLLTKPHTRKLVSLSLDGYNLSGMNEQLEVLQDIKVLKLKNTKLTVLPRGIEKLPNLEVLDLTGNNFTPEAQNEIRQKLPGVKITF